MSGGILFEIALPEEAIHMLYDILGHFPFDREAWSHIARANCSSALRDAMDFAIKDALT